MNDKCWWNKIHLPMIDDTWRCTIYDNSWQHYRFTWISVRSCAFATILWHPIIIDPINVDPIIRLFFLCFNLSIQKPNQTKRNVGGTRFICPWSATSDTARSTATHGGTVDLQESVPDRVHLRRHRHIWFDYVINFVPHPLRGTRVMYISAHQRYLLVAGGKLFYICWLHADS